MDIKKTRKQAHEMFTQHWRQLIPAFYIIYCAQTIIQLLSSGTLSLIFEFLLVTISHGFIYVVLKLIHQGDLQNLTLKDIFIGLFKFFDYFPSYFTRTLFVIVPTFLCFLPAFLISLPVGTNKFFEVVDQFIYLVLSNGVKIDYVLNVIQSLDVSTLIFIVLGIIVAIYLNLLFVFVPCIVEDRDYAWNEALKMSAMMMKGNMKELMRLYITFIPNIFLTVMISILFAYTVVWIPLINYSMYLIFNILATIVLYQIEFNISIALFYKEIRDEIDNPYEIFKI